MQAYYRRDKQGLFRIVPSCLDLRTRKWRDVTDVLQAIGGIDRRLTHAEVALRTFDHDCSGCHASQARLSIEGADSRMGAHWSENSINCESCHGAGGAHSAAWSALKTDAPLVKLHSLTPRASTAICGRCHGGPQASEDFGPQDAPHHIGMLFDRAGFFPDGSASGQVYQYDSFVRSPCFTEGKLSCSGCHDSHEGGLLPQAHDDALCTRCHEGYAQRTHTHHDARGAGARCVECHMPRLLSGIMAHQRDHRIRSPLPASEHVPDACTACHKDHDKQWAADAYRRLWGKPPRDDLNAIRAIALARKGDPRAKPLLRRALDHEDPFFRANAGIYLADAESLIDDASPEVRLAAVQATRRMDDPLPALRRLLADPERLVRAWAMRDLLRLGEPFEPEWEQDLTALLRHDRDRHPVEVVLGERAVKRGDWTEAEKLLERCVVNALGHPEKPRAGINRAWRLLTSVYASTGQREKERQAWREIARWHHDRWRTSRWESDELVRAIGALVRAEDWKRARVLLNDELRFAYGERERTTLRAMMLRLEQARSGE